MAQIELEKNLFLNRFYEACKPIRLPFVWNGWTLLRPVRQDDDDWIWDQNRNFQLG
jgi:hypothetical protein